MLLSALRTRPRSRSCRFGATPRAPALAGEQGDRYVATNITPVGLLMAAYQVSPDRIDGAPDWTRQEGYDVIARAPGAIQPAELPAMLQSMLGDRFRLAAKRETRDVQLYALTAPNPNAPGPRLRRTAIDCASAEEIARARADAPPGTPVCTGRTNSGGLAFSGMTMNALAQALAAPAGRPVINRTSLEGRFDIELEWGTLDKPDAVSIFTAVQEQLGLHLQQTTEPAQMLVIERIERPSEN